MRIERLDHVNLVTTRLREMVVWYEDILGLTTGPRPDFPFPGAWLYAGDHAVIHLVGQDGTPNVGSEALLKLEHFALSATGLNAFEERLAARGNPYTKTEVPGMNLVQLHVADPDGNHIHIDFEDNN